MQETRAYSLPYRKDIDGLRAVAVLPVCFFHLDLPGFPGGFVGVDVFFVISGYLMALLIGRELDAHAFSLRHFYERRARRILPALFFMLGVVSIGATFLMPPKLFKDFGETLVAAVAFGSNVLFRYKSANYFDAPTDWNPLLHTWSLGVEEQFYIVFPLYLLLLRGLGARARFVITAIVACCSLMLSIWGTQNGPTAAFYLLPTRAWELLLGALIALLMLGRSRILDDIRSSPRLASAVALAGLGLIALAMFGYDRNTAFPGVAALAPCGGAALLLAMGGSSADRVTRLLTIKPLPFIGRISYSLYLWHWPLIVYADRYLSYGGLNVPARIGVLCASLACAYAGWRWIEQPFRDRAGAWTQGWPRVRIAILACAASACLGAVGILMTRDGGWPQRFAGIDKVSLDAQLRAESADAAWREFDERHCFVKNPKNWGGAACYLNRGAGTAVLWGDSFAWAWAYGFFHNQGVARPAVLQYTSPQCPPILGYRAVSNPSCTAFNDNLERVVAEFHASTIIMTANWSSYLRRRKLEYGDIAATVSQLKNQGLKVVLVGQSPVFGFAYPDEYFLRKFGDDDSRSAYYAPLNAEPDINITMAQAANADLFFDPLRSLCEGQRCMFKRRKQYLVFDYGHWTHYGSSLAARELLGLAHEKALL